MVLPTHEQFKNVLQKTSDEMMLASEILKGLTLATTRDFLALRISCSEVTVQLTQKLYADGHGVFIILRVSQSDEDVGPRIPND